MLQTAEKTRQDKENATSGIFDGAQRETRRAKRRRNTDKKGVGTDGTGGGGKRHARKHRGRRGRRQSVLDSIFPQEKERRGKSAGARKKTGARARRFCAPRVARPFPAENAE